MTAAERSFQLTGLQRMQQRFEEAMAEPAASRAAWLREACGDDPGLLATLLDMVACAEAEHTGVALRIGALAGELAAPEDRSGTLIGRYRLQSRIRWGGMAEVYRAVRDDGQFQQEVALKIARSDRKAVTLDTWFEAERSLLARLRHPHICQIFDGGSSADGEPYFVMERIDGEPFLAACMNPAKPWKQIIGYTLDLCGAVAHAHRQLIVHRDIKPENVLLADGERVKLLDFGIAATLRPGDAEREGEWACWYSPGYAAPEITAGQTGGIAADVYSLGRLFESLIERAPAGQREDLRQICAHATEADPERRYESVDALAQDLRRLRDGLPISLRQQERGYLLRRSLNRWALPLSIGALLILLAALGVGREIQLRQLAQASALQAEIERDRARAVSDFLSSAYDAADPAVNAGEDITVLRFLELQAEALIDDAAMPTVLRADLLRTMGRAFLGLGRLQEADRTLARALQDLDDQTDTPTHALLRAQVRVIQAQVARQAGRNEDTAQILQELLEQEPSWPDDPEHVDLRVSMLTTLAALEQSRRRLDQAEQYIRRALALIPATDASEAAQVRRARQLVTLGSIQTVRDDLPAAQTSFEEGLRLIEQQHRRGQLERLSLYGWLGIVHDRLGRPDQAEAMLRAAVDAVEALYPNGHDRVSRAHGNLGTMLLVNGRLDEAETALQRAVATLDALPNADSDVLAGHKLRLARVALLREDLPRARALVAAHLQGFAERRGPDSPWLVPGWLARAQVELLAGRHADALLQTEQVQTTLAQAERVSDSTWTQASLLAGRAQAALGRADLARDLLRNAFAQLASQHIENPRVMGPLLELKADLLVDLGQHEEALAAYASALELYDGTVDANHPARGRCLLQMAMLRTHSSLTDRQQEDEAPSSAQAPEASAAMLREAAAILSASLVPDAPTLVALDRLQAATAP